MYLVLLSILQVILISSMVWVRVTGNWTCIFNAVLIATVINTLFIAIIGYPIFKKLIHMFKDKDENTVIIHLILHLPILIFVILDIAYNLNDNYLLVFSFFAMAFFYTAMITWRICYKYFNVKLYKVFAQGSTVLLFWCIGLTLLGLFYHKDFLTEKLNLMLLIYFTLHFVELGFVLMRIKHDLKAIRI